MPQEVSLGTAIQTCVRKTKLYRRIGLSCLTVSVLHRAIVKRNLVVQKTHNFDGFGTCKLCPLHPPSEALAYSALGSSNVPRRQCSRTPRSNCLHWKIVGHRQGGVNSEQQRSFDAASLLSVRPIILIGSTRGPCM